VKPRHAVALALVGWYLMVSPDWGTKDTPLSQWEIQGSYDTATECREAFEQRLNEEAAQLAADPTPAPGDNAALLEAVRPIL